MKAKIGLIINPIAGLGGKAGYKGSDCREHLEHALQNGYQKCSAIRARECLRHILDIKQDCILYAPAGEMGGNILTELGIPYQEICSAKLITSRSDTLDCLKLFLENDVDLIIFCGGDGTARDLCNVIGLQKPVIGIPAGVKMYSGCFAVNPSIAGGLLRNYIIGKPLRQELREVMDIDEILLGQPHISPHLYGYLQMINEGQKLQGPKAAFVSLPEEAEILADYFASSVAKDTLYIIGPGSTTYQIKQRLCGAGTLIGVDAILNVKLIHKDADENALKDLTEHTEKIRIIVTCIGGAGFVFGRGNQQISPVILSRVRKENICLAVTKSKLISLKGRAMLVDTGDQETDHYLCGYYKIHFSDTESTVYRIENMPNN